MRALWGCLGPGFWQAEQDAMGSHLLAHCSAQAMRKGSNGTRHVQAGILPLVCPLPSLMLEAAPASSLHVHSSSLSRCMRTAVHCAASPWAEPFSACVWGRKEPGQTQELSSPPLAAGEPSAAWPCASSAGESVSEVLGQQQLFPD